MEHRLSDCLMKKTGALAGMFAGALFSAVLIQPFRFLPENWYIMPVSAAIYLVCMALGWRIGDKKEQMKDEDTSRAVCIKNSSPKILDTSVIIDGRIFDICKAGFLDGDLIIPSFVLDELRHIADSADSIRRARGRRGLDILGKMQNDSEIRLRIEEKDYDDVEEVDIKLLRLSREMEGAVVTNDYNLNKVAGVAGMRVLNINELAGALRPVVLPGEEMHVRIIREGKEPGQGIAYLDDGTMVVIENGRRFVGENQSVIVTTVLQTSAGRMIFARMKMGESCAV